MHKEGFAELIHSQMKHRNLTLGQCYELIALSTTATDLPRWEMFSLVINTLQCILFHITPLIPLYHEELSGCISSQDAAQYKVV